MLIGSDGADLLLSLADGREPTIAQPWTAEDDPYGELTGGTLNSDGTYTGGTYYAGQPIEGDDILEGGGGADLFYFQSAINAKERIILEHVNADGTIEWGMNGVAGENDNVHDHWVDGFGDELIKDFNREEGDYIVMEGHTNEQYKLEYVDSDGDGNLDSSVIHVYSNQANGGAHDTDQLGTITVAGVLITSADYTINKVDHGIVPTIADLDEAITPYSSIPDDNTPPPIPEVNDGDPAAGVVLHAAGDLTFSGENDDYAQIEHYGTLELTDGTVAFSFRADNVDGWNALFSKDAHGTEVGGHLTAFVVDGRVKVRLQSTDSQQWLETDEGSVQAGREYHVAITFGAEGFQLYLDGVSADSRDEFTQGIDTNMEALAIGANIWGRSAEDPLYARDEFAGVISDFTIHQGQLTEAEIAALAGVAAGTATPGTEESSAVDEVFESIGS